MHDTSEAKCKVLNEIMYYNNMRYEATCMLHTDKVHIYLFGEYY